MELPLVSILITSYNREQYIEEAIESALNQSYKNTEIIIVDNCSTDSTIERLEKYKANSKISIYINESNIGQFPNRNKAAEFAKGIYLKYLDSDDILYPHSLEVMVAVMEKYPMCGLGISSVFSDFTEPYPIEVESAKALSLHFEKGLLFPGPGSIIYRKSIFEQLKGFEDFGLASDNMLTLKFALHSKIAILPKDLYWWRRHHDQEYNQMINNPEMDILYFKINQLILRSENCPLSAKQRTYYLFNQKSRLMRQVYKLFLKANVKEAFYLLQQSGSSFWDMIIALFPIRFLKK